VVEAVTRDPFASAPAVQDEVHVWHPDGARTLRITDFGGGFVLRIFIPGHPVPKGSMAPIINKQGRFCGMREDNPDSKPWRQAMVSHLRRAGLAGQLLTDPVAVTLTFHVQQKTTERTGAVWKSHDVPHPQAHDIGDLDKHIRNVLDALQPAKDSKEGAAVIKDDSQVVELVAGKTWAAESINGAPRVGVEIELRRL
jgi:Holliday junction resolvase RusA-like endonuclease